MDSRHHLIPVRKSPSHGWKRRAYSPPAPSSWKRIRQWVRLPAGDMPIVLEAIAWVAGATLLRMVADGLLALQPTLWIPVALVLSMPAVLAISLSIWAPPLTLILGYRLLLTAIGLVLGGRL